MKLVKLRGRMSDGCGVVMRVCTFRTLNMIAK